jgi:hypothetical protein
MVSGALRTALGAVLLLAPSHCGAPLQSNPEEQPSAVETIEGRLVRVMAIGGETTGWAVALGAERRVGESVVRQVEVDPAPRGLRLEPFENQRVEATGTWSWREGVERGRYPVFLLQTIRAESK